MYNYNLLNDNWQRNFNYSLRMDMNNMALIMPSIGYDRGNLFKDLYDQYKNYKPDTLETKTEQEKLFLELARMSFAAHELNLYLDLNPDDVGMLKLFNDYRHKSNELRREYEEKYGPLCINSNSLNNTPFMWEKSPWPWEV